MKMLKMLKMLKQLIEHLAWLVACCCSPVGGKDQDQAPLSIFGAANAKIEFGAACGRLVDGWSSRCSVYGEGSAGS
jgi:hypothetical protein